MSPQRFAAVAFGNRPERKQGEGGRLLTQALFANTTCVGLPHLSPDIGGPSITKVRGRCWHVLFSVLHLGTDRFFCPSRLGCGDLIIFSVGILVGEPRPEQCSSKCARLSLCSQGRRWVWESVSVSSGCHSEYPSLGGLNHRCVFWLGSGGQKSDIRVSAETVL